MNRRIVPVLLMVAMIGSGSTAQADWTIDLEGGVAVNGYNDVRIPGDTGTEISLTDDLEADATIYQRTRLTVALGDRHRLSALIAPLRIEASGRLDRDVDFNGVRFDAGNQVTSRYRFDSYRLTYSYVLSRSDNFRFDLGFTAKVRDASIKLESEAAQSEKTNTGFVPLIHFALDWSFASRLGLLVKGDALAAPQGRAEDVLAGLYTNLSDRVRFRVGYRILEGGADNDEVYSFALVHYFSAGLRVVF